MKESGSGNGGIQVIARAAAILRVLREDTSGMSLGRIAEKVDLPRSTVQRIISALQAERLVISSSSGGTIRLGPEIKALSEATHYSVVEMCRLHLLELSQKVTETVDLSVLRGSGMIFLDQVPGTHRLRTVSAIGDVFPLTTTANGRAVLSMMDRARARDLVETEWKRREMREDWPEFAAKLDATAATGIAYDLDEHTVGISAVGAGFTDMSGELHAISVPIPSTRFREKHYAVERSLVATIEQVRAIIE